MGVSRAGRGGIAPGRVVTVLLALLVLSGGAGCASAAGDGISRTPAAPTATPTTRQRLTLLVTQAIGGEAQQVSVALAAGDAGADVATVSVTVGGPVPGTEQEIAASQERVKAICYRAEQAAWTSGVALSEVTVTVTGPIYDDYADLTTGPYGAADLKAPAAAKLDWAHLSPDAGWGAYGVWLRPAYRSKVLGQ